MNRLNVGFGVLLVLVCFISISYGEIPNLIGNWSGTYIEYQKDTGYLESGNDLFFLNVTLQHDRIIAGYFKYVDKKGSSSTRDFSGVINSEGTEFSLAETDNGYSTGKFIGLDELEITYLNDREPVIAALDHFRRIQ